MVFQRDPVTNEMRVLYLPFRRDRLSGAEVVLVLVTGVAFGVACFVLGYVWALENSAWGGRP